jgi:hypothetical protein
MPKDVSSAPADRVGVIASWTVSACAVHCAITPFAVGLLPLIGLGFHASAWFEWSMVAAAALLGGAGLGVSYARAHRDRRPLAVFLVGVAVLVAANLVLEHRDLSHTAAALVGAGLMFAAGRMNHNCSRHGAHDHEHDHDHTHSHAHRDAHSHDCGHEHDRTPDHDPAK